MSQLLRMITFRNNHGICAPIMKYSSKFIDKEASRRQQDSLMQTVRSANKPDELLNTVSQNIHKMEPDHLIQVLRSLFDIYKDKRKKSNVKDIHKEPIFATLCEIIKRNASVLEINECIDALKILSYLEVPVDTVIMQTILQMIRKNINELNMRQIMFIDFLLSKYSAPNPLIDALKMALPLVFQIHLPLEMDYDDLSQLNDMLMYASSHDIPDRCINNIITGFLIHGDQIDHATARNVVWALAAVNTKEDIHHTRWKLLRICLDIVAKNIKKYSPTSVIKLASRILTRTRDKHLEFYNEELFDAFASYAVQESMDIGATVVITRLCASVMHSNFELLDYVIRLAHENLEYIKSAMPGNVLSLLYFISNANYELDKKMLTDILDAICKNDVLKWSSGKKLPYARTNLELASLGYFNLDFLSEFYKEENLNSYLERTENRNALDYMQILIVHEGAKLFCDGYNLSPPDNVLKKAYDVYSMCTDNGLLEGPLNLGLNGEEYYATNVQLPCGFIVDHIIAFQDGVPIKISAGKKAGKTSLEQLNIPQSAVVACILKFNKSCYSINKNRLRGQYRLILDIIHAQGYPTLAVSTNSFIQIPESEQSPYLMRELQTACRDMKHRVNIL